LWYTNNQLFLAHISYILSLSLSLSVFLFETNSYYVVQAGLWLLGLRDTPTSASQKAGTTRHESIPSSFSLSPPQPTINPCFSELCVTKKLLIKCHGYLNDKIHVELKPKT
jgi:hypothetical protein